MWSPYQLSIAVGMVITGSINTLATKWADKQSAPGPQGTNHIFDHPFLQAVGMFVGEFSCLLVFKIWYYWHKYRKNEMNFGNQNFSPVLFLGPALCDMTGTSLMYIGLNYTYASSFQMLRGAIIVFTALLSVAFLGSVIKRRAWFGIFLTIIGLALVGISDIVFSSSDEYGPNEILTGDLIILIAQIISGVQMVVEEKFVNGKDIHPLQAVGWEGFFGMTILGVLLIPMYYIPAGEFSGNPRGVLEDALDGLYQIGQNSTLAIAQIGSICSIAFFNFFGISVTKELSATTRMVLDSIRTLVIWGVSLAVQWEAFQWLQVVGFAILICGTGIYNNLIPIPCLNSTSPNVLEVNQPEEEDKSSNENTPLLYNTQEKA
uniref:Solute carrier family 35 member F6-like n=1 Tax=Phallusia mammillata TaxID=59560 RepID=A0A6F9DS19_9ASCI|nr:solute carrier family 35 member F6-like [Phallusia mammillata]